MKKKVMCNLSSLLIVVMLFNLFPVTSLSAETNLTEIVASNLDRMEAVEDGEGYGSSGQFLEPIEAPASGAIQISTANQLYNIQNNLSGYYVLVADIDISTGYVWSGGIGTKDNPFTGTFDGQGHVINNFKLTVYSSDYNGLFGYANNATIKNVGMVDTKISIGAKNPPAYRYVGAICAYAKGSTKITNCFNSGTSESYPVDSPTVVGGICGYIGGKTSISSCYNAGEVYAIVHDDLILDPKAGSTAYVGGICGYSESSNAISNCYNTALVAGGYYGNPGSLSPYSSCAFSGGICGYNDYGSILNCYNAGSVYANSEFIAYCGGICGRTDGDIDKCVVLSKHIGGIVSKSFANYIIGCNGTYGNYNIAITGITGNPVDDPNKRITDPQAKTQSTYTDLGWDFNTVWQMVGSNYPQLRTAYTVSFDANGGSGAPYDQTKIQAVTLTLDSTRPTKYGSEFKGWDTNSAADTVRYLPGGSYTDNASVTLYAVWEPLKYTVTYDVKGGSPTPDPQTKIHGINLTLDSTRPTKDGSEFKGWDTNSAATTPQYQPSGSYTDNASVTLYAVWEPLKYTVTYDAKGGSPTPDPQIKTHGIIFILDDTIPTKDGFEFKGWDTNSAADTVRYQPGGSYTDNASVTLYAVWEPLKYTVTYDAKGGSPTPDPQTKTYGINLTLNSTRPDKDDFKFKGWDTNSSATTVRYPPGGIYTENAPVTLYAVWQSITPRLIDLSISEGALDPEFDPEIFDYKVTVNRETTSMIFKAVANDPSAWIYLDGSDKLHEGELEEEVALDVGGKTVVMNAFLDGNNQPYTIEITHIICASLRVDPDSRTFGAANGSAGSFEITSNVTWSITGEQDWFNLSSTSGSNNETITVTAKSTNHTTSTREATLTVAGEGIAKEVSVTQEADSAGDPKLRVSSVTERAGEEVTMTVSLENNPGIASFGLVMQYNPSLLTYVTASTGDIITSNFRNDWVLSDNQLRFRAYDSDGKFISTGTKLFTVTFKINDETKPGIIGGDDLKFFYLSPVFDGLSIAGGTVEYEIMQGNVTVSDIFYGDVNGEGKLNSSSQTTMNRFFSGLPVPVFIEKNADVNGDGKLDSSDQTRMNRFFSGLDPRPLGPDKTNTAMAMNAPCVAEEPIVSITSAEGKAGKEVTMTVSLENNPGIASFSLVMQYNPSLLTYVTASVGDIITGNFRNDWRLADNQLRFRAYDSDGKFITTGTTLFTVTFKINDETKPGIIDGDDLKFGYSSPIFDGFSIVGDTVEFEIKQGSITVIPDDPVNYAITVTAGTGGTVTGGGSYLEGSNVTVEATANTGYTFEGWYEGGAKVSEALAKYDFTAIKDRTLEARFTAVLVEPSIVIGGHTICTGWPISGGVINIPIKFSCSRNILEVLSSGYSFTISYDSTMLEFTGPVIIGDPEGSAFTTIIHHAEDPEGTLRVVCKAAYPNNLNLADAYELNVPFKVIGTPALNDFSTLKLSLGKVQKGNQDDGDYLNVTTKVVYVAFASSVLMGDINGDGMLTPEDAMELLQMYIGLRDWTPWALLVGDVNCDGLVDTTDAALILRMVVGG
jgi:hypothetical protein